MRTIYLAGPFTAPTAWERSQNCRRAAEVAAALWALGAAVISPHLNSGPLYEAAPEAVFFRGCLTLVSRADAVVLLPGWEDSYGTLGEKVVAEQRGLPVWEWASEAREIEGWVRGEGR